LGAELNQILAQEALLAAKGLLAVAVRELRPVLPQFPETAVAEVQRTIAKAQQEGKSSF
jgi:hypothetical protein